MPAENLLANQKIRSPSACGNLIKLSKLNTLYKLFYLCRCYLVICLGCIIATRWKVQQRVSGITFNIIRDCLSKLFSMQIFSKVFKTAYFHKISQKLLFNISIRWSDTNQTWVNCMVISYEHCAPIQSVTVKKWKSTVCDKKTSYLQRINELVNLDKKQLYKSPKIICFENFERT